MRVIVVEDNILFCDYICNFLQNADYQTVKAYRLAQARQVIARSVREDDIVLADLRLPDGESTALLEWMREQGYTHPFIMMTNYEEIHTAVHAMKLGAEDYILKPLLEDKLLPALKKIRMADEAFAKVIYERKSAAFRELDRYIRLVAPTDMTVLILGNTGTGKEHLAGKIHKRSLRANKPYITVDCGSVRKTAAHGIVLECIFFVVAVVFQQVDAISEATQINLPLFSFEYTSDLFIDFAFGIIQFVLIVYTFVGISGIFQIDDIHAVSANP